MGNLFTWRGFSIGGKQYRMVAMKTLLKAAVILLVSCLSSMQAIADVVPTLYQADYPVTDRTAKVREQAIPIALRQVFTKVTGNPEIATLSSVQDALSKANTYVQSYSYIQGADDQWLLHVTFDSTDVDQLLRQAGQAIWGKDRPTTVVWLVAQTGKDRNLVASDDDTEAGKALQNSAQQYGLPITLPLGDLEDMFRVSVSDVWNLDPSIIKQSAKRYNDKNVLIGRVEQRIVGNTWNGQWLFSLNGEPMRWKTQGKTLDQTLNAAMSDVAEAMAARFAVLSDNALKQKITLEVTDVDGLDTYADVMKYLHSLEPVTEVEVADLEPDMVQFYVTSLGGEQALANAINTDHRLIAVPSNINTNQG